MLRKHVLIGAAACAALAFAGLTRADVSAPVTTSDSNNVVYLQAAPASAPATTTAAAPVTPLNGAIANIPAVGTFFGNAGLSAVGYVEGSWTYTSHTVGGNYLADRVFDTQADSLQFDAVDLAISRTASASPFDIGFTLEQLYGWDGAYIHSNGLTIYSPSKIGFAAHPKAQYDLNQANIVFSFATIGHGLSIEAGKFDTLLGYEVIDATGNAFFSHSYIFDEEPFTHTGVIATYNITDPNGPTPFTATGGITRGWDQALKDNNGSIDATGQLKYTVTNKYSVLLNVITGDESPSGSQDGWRTVIDANGTYNASDQLTLGFNGMYAWQAQAKYGGVGAGTGSWYGFAGYAGYKISDQVTVNARAEWFDDQNGSAPTQLAVGPAVGAANQFYEVTLGVSLKPLADANATVAGLTIRPEARWDYSDHAAFNEGTQNDQWTAAIEAYFSY